MSKVKLHWYSIRWPFAVLALFLIPFELLLLVAQLIPGDPSFEARKVLNSSPAQDDHPATSEVKSAPNPTEQWCLANNIDREHCRDLATATYEKQGYSRGCAEQLFEKLAPDHQRISEILTKDCLNEFRRTHFVRSFHQDYGFSNDCAGQLFDKGSDPVNGVNGSRQLSNIGLTEECLQETERINIPLTDFAKALGTTVDTVNAFASIPDSDIQKESDRIEKANGGSLDDQWKLQSDTAMRNCIAVSRTRSEGHNEPQQCESPEDLQPFRDRLVLFLVADKEVWLSPDDVGFQSLQPYSGDDQRKRASILARIDSYSKLAIALVQSHIAPTEYLRSIWPGVTMAKLINHSAWTVVDNSRWCEGCWMVTCTVNEVKPEERLNNSGRIYGVYGIWEAKVDAGTIAVADDRTATSKFFATTN